VLTIELHTPAGFSQASATSESAGRRPSRGLLAFDGIDIETPLEGNCWFAETGLPGVIGKIGIDSGLNRRQHCQLRAGPAERLGAKPVKALAVVQVDAPVSTRCWRRSEHRGGTGSQVVAVAGGGACRM